MSKIEELTLTASSLSDEQLDGLINYATYIASEPLYYAAPPDVIASIERGLAENAIGNTLPAEDVFSRIQNEIEAARA